MHTDASQKVGPMTDLDQVRIYIAEQMSSQDERQERRVAEVYSRIETLSSSVTGAADAMRDLSASLNLHVALEEQWRSHHEGLHAEAIIPRIASLEESRKFVTNKVLGYVLTGVLAASGAVGVLVWVLNS